MTTSTRSEARVGRQQQELAAREVERRRTAAWAGGLVIVLLLAAIAVAVALAAGGDRGEPDAQGPLVVPANATADGVVAVGQDEAPVTVTVFFDYLCPFCGRFEVANSARMEALVDSGRARVEFRPMAFLDPRSEGTRYSTRAANALATVSDGAPERTWAFHRALFHEQPAEGTPGLDDDRIEEIARRVGVPPAVTARFRQGAFEPWVAQATSAAFAAEVKGTPTVLVDGEPFEGDLYAPGALADAVRTAGSR